MNCEISPWTMCQNKPHNICHSEGSHSCSWTHIVPHWWQNHCCIHILLHKVCCSSLVQEGQCKLLDKHWCMDCNDCWESTQQLKNNKRHCIDIHNSHETTIQTKRLFWTSDNVGFFEAWNAFLILISERKKKTFYKKKAWMFNTYSGY